MNIMHLMHIRICTSHILYFDQPRDHVHSYSVNRRYAKIQKQGEWPYRILSSPALLIIQSDRHYPDRTKNNLSHAKYQLPLQIS